ncbi:unnamed protein product [Bursaphelenchus okinawaensis]|uniref:Uncharacterized protein n=1 Tax=Bursaphelenchus okinawaensis TaxID=465554 RepID=A0A811K8Q1_9BILA|nr:unnamed protein product [Bursaphelenchus okinawaensis]CAG9095147.1 unnamed protein product [Bursaphelenchus okinawaensis]
MEGKLLQLARENYRDLKKEFEVLLSENIRLKNQITKLSENEQSYVKNVMKDVVHDIEVEKKMREHALQDFKKNTVTNIREMYEDTILRLLSEQKEDKAKLAKHTDVVKEKDEEIGKLKEALYQFTHSLQ